MLEKSLPRCQLIWEEMEVWSYKGTARTWSICVEPGVTRADTVVAVTDRDETNLVVCQLAKHAFSVERTVTTIKDPKYQPIFRLLGVNAVVDIRDLVLDKPGTEHRWQQL